jgi:hypothetical protein
MHSKSPYVDPLLVHAAEPTARLRQVSNMNPRSVSAAGTERDRDQSVQRICSASMAAVGDSPIRESSRSGLLRRQRGSRRDAVGRTIGAEASQAGVILTGMAT